MEHERHRHQTLRYEPESWRDDDCSESSEVLTRRQRSHPDVRDQSLILELLARINYRIIKGGKVYIEAGGVTYKTLYGGYWRSVFTGVEHYLLKCEKVSGSIWTEGSEATTVLDLPIVYSKDGWTARGHSVSFMLSRDSVLASHSKSWLSRLVNRAFYGAYFPRFMS